MQEALINVSLLDKEAHLRMFCGLFAGLASGALWGLAFVAPLAVRPFTPFDLTMIRYLIFGIFSIIDLRSRHFSVQTLNFRDWRTFLMLGFAGHVGFYFALSMAIPLAGPTVVVMVLGCMPLIMSLVGNKGPQRIAFKRLIFPSSMAAFGLVIINLEALAELRSMFEIRSFVEGISLTFVSISLWVCYGLQNAHSIRNYPKISSRDWTDLTGIASLIVLLPFVPIGCYFGMSSIPSHLGSELDMAKFLTWGILVGIFASWAAQWTWSIAARRLPVTLAAQLILSETVFGFFYTSVFMRQLPSWTELFGAALLLLGVIGAVNQFQNRHKLDSVWTIS